MLVKVVKNQNQAAIYGMTLHACELLDISPSVIEIDDLVVTGTNGMCIDLSETEFLILLKDHDQMLRTLVHELVHVKQYMKQDLGRYLDTHSKEYENSWWEVEARDLANKIMESYDERNDTREQRSI